MALPDSDKVIQELNRRFAAPLPEFYARRIIFWYDENKDFEEKVQTGEIELSDAKLVTLGETNNFEIKKLLTHDDKTSNFCVYCSVTYPDDKNWLLPVQLYSEEFRADLVSIWLEEMCIENTANLRKTVKDYRSFFKTKAHRTKMASLNQKITMECLLWSDPKNRSDEDVELISIIRMSPGLDLEIRKNDEGIRGVKFYKPNGDLLEFAPFSEDGKGLECNNAYDHITIDPANNDREAQLVRVGWNLIDTSLKPQ